MTRTEAELKIIEKAIEMKAIMLEYNPEAEYLSVSITKHTDPEDDLFVLGEWTISIHNSDKAHLLDAFVSGGEVYSRRVGSAGEVIAEGVTV